MKSGQEKAKYENKPVTKIDCQDIQKLLFDYMAKELGEAQSNLVREHLRKCPVCQDEAAQIQDTLDLLKSSEDDLDLPDHLNDKHRDRITWALAHPLLDWIYRNHIAVSIVVTIIVFILSCFAIQRILRHQEAVIEAYRVDIVAPVDTKLDTIQVIPKDNMDPTHE